MYVISKPTLRLLSVTLALLGGSACNAPAVESTSPKIGDSDLVVATDRYTANLKMPITMNADAAEDAWTRVQKLFAAELGG